MARKRTILDDLATSPWWINLIFAAIAYFFFKYFIPSIEFESLLYEGVGNAASSFVLIFTMVPLVAAVVSAFRAWRNGELLEKQTSVKSLQELPWQEFESLINEVFKRKGYAVLGDSRGDPDGGIDLTLKKGNEKTLVQCFLENTESWGSCS